MVEIIHFPVFCATHLPPVWKSHDRGFDPIRLDPLFDGPDFRWSRSGISRVPRDPVDIEFTAIFLLLFPPFRKRGVYYFQAHFLLVRSVP